MLTTNIAANLKYLFVYEPKTIDNLMVGLEYEDKQPLKPML